MQRRISKEQEGEIKPLDLTLNEMILSLFRSLENEAMTTYQCVLIQKIRKEVNGKCH